MVNILTLALGVRIEFWANVAKITLLFTNNVPNVGFQLGAQIKRGLTESSLMT